MSPTKVTGVNAIPALVEQARRADDDDFRVLPYEQITASGLDIYVDAPVCNLSLLGNTSTGEGFAREPLHPRMRKPLPVISAAKPR